MVGSRDKKTAFFRINTAKNGGLKTDNAHPAKKSLPCIAQSRHIKTKRKTNFYLTTAEKAVDMSYSLARIFSGI